MHETDQEQIEAMKNWWSKNGSAVSIGIIIFAVVLLGWTYFQKAQLAASEAASDAYYEMTNEYMTSTPNSDSVNALEIAVNDFNVEFSDSTYAVYAQLLLAQQFVATEQEDKALTALITAESNASAELLPLVKIRIARLLISAGEVEQAKAKVESIDSSEFVGARAELLGDIYLLLGETEQAATQYKLALDNVPASSERQVLRLKAETLGIK